MSLIKKAAKGAAHAIDQAFESLHPRLGAGHGEHSGEFVDVKGILEGAGGIFDEERGIWTVPVHQREVIDKLLDDIGYESVSLPPEFRIAQPSDRDRVYWPPGWKQDQVFISDDPRADLQVIGYDRNGERQYLYSTEHTDEKSIEKYARVAQLTDKLPSLDRKLAEDVQTEDAAVATMIMRKMGIRPGGAGQKGKVETFGATTLKREHVQISGSKVRLRFVGKHGIEQDVPIEDAELAAALKPRLKGLQPGDRLFPGLHPRKMRDYFKEATGGEQKLYDLRTHFGTGEGLRLLDAMPVPTTFEGYVRQRKEIGERVAEKLGNKPQEALDSYIDPRVFDAWPDPGSLPSERGAKVIPTKELSTALRQAQALRESKQTPPRAAPSEPKDVPVPDLRRNEVPTRDPEAERRQRLSEGARKAVAARSKESLSSSAQKAVAARKEKQEARKRADQLRKGADLVRTATPPNRANLDRRADAFVGLLGAREKHAIGTYLRDGPAVDSALRYNEDRPSARRVPDIDKAFDRAPALDRDVTARRFVDMDDLFGEDVDPFVTVGEEFTDPRYVMMTTRSAEQMATPEGKLEMVVRVPTGTRPIPFKGGAMMMPHGSHFRVVGVEYDAHGRPRLLAEITEPDIDE